MVGLAMLRTFAEFFPVLVLWAFGWMLPASVLALVFVHLGRHGYLRPFADLFHAARRLSLVGWLCVAPLVVGLVGYASCVPDTPWHRSAGVVGGIGALDDSRGLGGWRNGCRQDTAESDRSNLSYAGGRHAFHQQVHPCDHAKRRRQSLARWKSGQCRVEPMRRKGTSYEEEMDACEF